MRFTDLGTNSIDIMVNGGTSTGGIQTTVTGIDVDDWAREDLLGIGSLADGSFGGATQFPGADPSRSEEHTSELQSHHDLVCRLLLEKKKPINVHLADATLS